MSPSEEQPRAVAAAKKGEGETGKEEDRRGSEKVARELLKPRRRAQIEVWLGETVSRWETQRCAAGRLFGHRSDLLIASPATSQLGESPPSTSVDGDDICPVCGRSSEDGAPFARPPGKDAPWLNEGKPGKGKHMFGRIRAAMGQLRARDGGRTGEKDEEEWDRGVSTHMFLAEASEDGSSVGTALSSSGRPNGGDGKALEERMARLTRAQKLLDKSQARR
ncbi:hypothetical protein UCDDA912_g03162 [Diaporthe ampelina]|uniref:Uncharacterized protein n=1 Tax=Diaporthe ampelina TaxID=1214573 RepID=A0A0G2HPG0_9PEZI|nr:hypothetical protein UCDDA912_g03162 [Diaporthe ampelina]